MPRKKVITRKVRRLTPREIDLMVCSAVAFEMEMTDGTRDDYYEKEQEALRGMFKNLAIIVEE